MVIVRTLTPLELPRYQDHLLRLGADDRRLRFGFPISNERIVDFVDRLGLCDTHIMVHSGPDMEVIGAVQVSVASWDAVEFAFSVEHAYRGRGIATALFERALLWARNRRIRRAYVQCLAENQAMRRIARKAGMAIRMETGESEGALCIPAATPMTLLNELTTENAGLLDAAIKANHMKIGAFAAWLSTPLAVE